MPRRSKTAPETSDALTDAEDLGDAYVVAPERVKPDDESTYLTLPTLILPQTLLLPRMSLPYPLDDEEETQAVDDAIKHDRLILVLAAQDQDEDDDDPKTTRMRMPTASRLMSHVVVLPVTARWLPTTNSARSA